MPAPAPDVAPQLLVADDDAEIRGLILDHLAGELENRESLAKPKLETALSALRDHGLVKLSAKGALEPPESPAALELWFRSKRPVARHYVEAIVAEKHFRRIHRLNDCLPGDIVATKYPKGNANTGHVMLVAERPRKRVASAPLVEATEQWEVKIIDCTTSPHSSGWPRCG